MTDFAPRYPRDMTGYGPRIPDARWPGGARIAISLVLNYEEGGENSILHGDAASEAFLSDIAGAQPWPAMRHWNMESLYDYGARAGFWRLHRLFTGRRLPVTIYGVATALARNPEQVAAMKQAGWEIASHGLKWTDHRDMPEEAERAAIAEAMVVVVSPWTRTQSGFSCAITLSTPSRMSLVRSASVGALRIRSRSWSGTMSTSLST
jgi:chitin deacetylase